MNISSTLYTQPEDIPLPPPAGEAHPTSGSTSHSRVTLCPLLLWHRLLCLQKWPQSNTSPPATHWNPARGASHLDGHNVLLPALPMTFHLPQHQSCLSQSQNKGLYTDLLILYDTKPLFYLPASPALPPCCLLNTSMSTT